MSGFLGNSLGFLPKGSGGGGGGGSDAVIILGAGALSSVRCGASNVGTGCASFVSGFSNSVSGNYGVISGGRSNQATAPFSFVGGGCFNEATQQSSIVLGGACNTASSYYSVVLGGFFNTSSGYCSTVINGFTNAANADGAFVGGGQFNSASSYKAAIVNGRENCITSSDYSFIANGCMNRVCGGCFNAINGGFDNVITGEYSTISGGYGNLSTHNFSGIFGCGIDSIKACTWHVNNLAVMNTPANNNALEQVLVRCTTGEIAYRCGTSFGASVAGSNTQVQFNDSGVFGADSGLTFNKTTNSLTVGVCAADGGFFRINSCGGVFPFLIDRNSGQLFFISTFSNRFQLGTDGSSLLELTGGAGLCVNGNGFMSGIVFKSQNTCVACWNISNTNPLDFSDFNTRFQGNVIFDRTARLKGFTVATLPAAGTAGRMAYVTDALAPTYLAVVAGGGAVIAPVFDDGTNWITA